MDKKNCQHIKWVRTGLWDGKDLKTGEPTGGPMIRCAECGLEKKVTYPEWGQIQKDFEAEKERVMRSKIAVLAAEQREKAKKYLPAKKRPLWFYVIAVIVVLAVLNFLAVSRDIEAVSGGILIGMLAMYIAVHFYKWK